MADNKSKVNLGGPKARRYANMTSKDLMAGRKPQMYIDAAAEITGMDKSGQKKGFKTIDAGEVVERLLS